MLQHYEHIQSLCCATTDINDKLVSKNLTESYKILPSRNCRHGLWRLQEVTYYYTEKEALIINTREVKNLPHNH